MHIVIVGGGITGCVAAYVLAKRGHAVTLLEARRIAAMASGWTLGGVRQSGRHLAELPLAREAVRVWPGLSEKLGGDTGYVQKGNLRLARTTAEVPVIAALVEEQQRLGLDLRFLPDNEAVREVAPALSGAVQAASFCPSDGFADPVAATTAFARAAERLGASISEGFSVLELVLRGERVAGVETTRGFMEADAVIVAAGTHTPALLEPLGLRLPLEVTQVQVVLTEPAAPVFAQVFGVANADCAGRQQPDGRFRFTSGLTRYAGDPERWSEAALKPAAADIATLRQKVGSVLPVAAETPVERSWGGLIDLTPDHLPVIDAPLPGLVVAAGFSGHGFGIAPVTGRLAAELAIGERPFLDISAFRLDRAELATAPAAPLELHG